MRLQDHDGILSKGNAFRVDPRVLKIESGFNIRDLDAPTAREALDELKASIRAEGVQVPLEIRLVGDDLFVVSGHRRHKVVMELISEGAEINSVPAIAEPKTIDEADRTARLITLNAGEPLSGLEKAEVIRRLLGYGWDRAKIAQRLGFKSPQTVANFELMLSAPAEVKAAVREGKISVSNAVEMVRMDGPKAVETLQRASATATARGKSKITRTSIKPAVERQPEPPRNQAAVDRALTLLNDVVNNDYAAATAAGAFMALKADDVALVIAWLSEFEGSLRDKENFETERQFHVNQEVA